MPLCDRCISIRQADFKFDCKCTPKADKMSMFAGLYCNHLYIAEFISAQGKEEPIFMVWCQLVAVRQEDSYSGGSPIHLGVVQANPAFEAWVVWPGPDSSDEPTIAFWRIYKQGLVQWPLYSARLWWLYLYCFPAPMVSRQFISDD